MTVLSNAHIDLSALVQSSSDGTFVLPAKVRSPGADGVFYTARLELPKWTRSVYFAPFQRHAIDPTLDLWPEGYNQCHAVPLSTIVDAKRGGMFLILQLDSDDYLALLPLVGPESMAWMRGDGEGLLLEAGHFGTELFSAELPLFAWSRHSDIYQAAARVWQTALADPALDGLGKLRHDKKYPEPLEYLGWCSFEHFKLSINEEVIAGAFRAIRDSEIPIRWALIDDGHIIRGSTGKMGSTQEGELTAGGLASSQLGNFGADPVAFPNGFQPLVQLAHDCGIDWTGLWLQFSGYWGGVSLTNAMSEDEKSLLTQVGNDRLLPSGEFQSIYRFYSLLVNDARTAGFDFLKVDGQAGNIKMYAGETGNAVRAGTLCKKAWEGELAEHFQGMINCMAHNNLCSFNTPSSQVTRCSEDYKNGDTWRAKHHIHNSFANMLWLGQTVWGDHDMFHSSDSVAGELMARSKAVSGGPVYLSDHPDDFRSDLIRPLCLKDGRILRPLAPAVPLADSLFSDPYDNAVPFRVVAPLDHLCAAIVLYNITDPEVDIVGSFSDADYRSAGALLKPGNDFSESATDDLVVFDWIEKRAFLLKKPGWTGLLPPLSDRLFLLSPISKGWALIGNPTKFLSPSFVSTWVVCDDSAIITAPEAGTILVWSAGTVTCTTAGVSKVSENLWEIDVVDAAISHELRH